MKQYAVYLVMLASGQAPLRRRWRWCWLAGVLAGGFAAVFGGVIGFAAGEQPFITLASTTSTDNSGLFGHILPRFEAETGIKVQVVAVGTGQAIKIARHGDADVLLVHDEISELKFVANGAGLDRRQVMYNDFVLVGSKSDPAGVAGGRDVVAALQMIAKSRSVFISRGDDSGTHKAELRFWRAGAVDVRAASGSWYLEVGAGMGATLNAASALDGYCLSDRATWLAFANKRDLAIVFQSDPRLYNQYGVILVNPARHPHIKAKAARIFVEWLTSPAGQGAIAEFRINGQPMFVPNYRAPPR